MEAVFIYGMAGLFTAGMLVLAVCLANIVLEDLRRAECPLSGILVVFGLFAIGVPSLLFAIATLWGEAQSFLHYTLTGKP